MGPGFEPVLFIRVLDKEGIFFSRSSLYVRAEEKPSITRQVGLNLQSLEGQQIILRAKDEYLISYSCMWLLCIL